MNLITYFENIFNFTYIFFTKHFAALEKNAYNILEESGEFRIFAKVMTPVMGYFQAENWMLETF